MESMKQKFFRAAVPLVMLAVSAALSVFVYRLPQPVREPLPEQEPVLRGKLTLSHAYCLAQIDREELSELAGRMAALGVSLAEELLNNGAREILTEVYNGEPPA